MLLSANELKKKIRKLPKALQATVKNEYLRRRQIPILSTKNVVVTKNDKITKTSSSTIGALSLSSVGYAIGSSLAQIQWLSIFAYG